MRLDEAKLRFVEAWGTLGSNWGINRTMAQIHALLLVSDKPLSTDDIMEQLDISRGNANMNLRALIDWGLAERKLKMGERMEFFAGEKDMWKVAVKIIKERKEKEITPLRNTLKDLKVIDDKEDKSEQSKQFLKLIDEIEAFALAADRVGDKMFSADRSWFFGSLMKLILK